MQTKNEVVERLRADVLALGAHGVGVIEAAEAVTDRSFRDACRQNACGMYGKCWTCPPDAGEIDELIASLKQYRYMLLYQTVGTLEDSFDFEGMGAVKKVQTEKGEKERYFGLFSSAFE